MHLYSCPSFRLQNACGCAGCFTATNTMPLLAHVFEEDGKLENLEKFASQNGPAFYQLPENPGQITLVKSEAATQFPTKIASDDGPVTLFDPGYLIYWSVA